MEFVRDFFFTDIANHVEFMKRTQTLNKGDDVLLIGILERLVSPEPARAMIPFYGSVLHDERRRLQKNPLHIAKGYALMQDLDEHEYNIFECAYLSTESSWQTRCAAFIALLIQFTFLGVLIVYNVLESLVIITPGEEFFREVVAVMLVSAALFASSVRSQFMSCADFVTAMRELKIVDKSREMFLVMDVLVNEYLGICIFFFNIYFILVSDSPTEAVLNSVALAFIIEIDDFFKPNWNEDTIEDAIAFVLRDYITEPFDSEELVVGREGPPILTDDRKFYIQVSDEVNQDDSFSVMVHIASREDAKMNVTLSYDTTTYQVIGVKAPEFHSALMKFHCLDNFRDLSEQ
mmetsp:Transcript_53243/g.159399  ORF Transcript_53243/g.159399 Transcript_53243/m.159399 type:complete len:348 (-) Transcript_53243:362-1405(-)|eukprot:CAMPEP_0113525552 /NCGR_PEP_ID=MMETSP0015_2-20120614/228_1 /TAXON_ID=2838 /ORGANISM="Odontella" /LENGTH=347 /DNA_ID=CAMNT_0000423737 /DNA_START=391 /DNA_END=1434 /DNA_ORIENTATION=+ /assembly_acc=CAM_ASM_000160